MKYRFESGGKTLVIDVELSEKGARVCGPDGQAQLIRIETRADGSQHAVSPWGEFEVTSARRGSEIWARIGGRRIAARAERARPTDASSANGRAAGALVAPMAGRLLRVDVRLGDSVRAGQPLAVIEAMKMENELLAPIAGVVTEVAVVPPAAIEKGTLILRLEAP